MLSKQLTRMAQSQHTNMTFPLVEWYAVFLYLAGQFTMTVGHASVPDAAVIDEGTDLAETGCRH